MTNPTEITEAMVEAGRAAMWHRDSRLKADGDTLRYVYLAMQSASPPPVTASAEEVERLGDVLDIIAVAETFFARTPKHHAYYQERHKALAAFISSLGREKVSEGVERYSLEDVQRVANEVMIAANGKQIVGVNEWVRDRLSAALKEGASREG